MTEGPTIDRGVVTPIIRSLAALGGDVDTLVEDSGLRSSWSDMSSDVMPEARVWELFERSARSLDMPDVGLRVGAAFEVRDLGLFGRQLENSLTVFGCLSEYIETVNRFSSHSKFWLEQRSEGVWFCRQGIDLIDIGRNYVEQFTLQLMIRLVRLACGRRWLPASIQIQAQTDRFYRADPAYDCVEMFCQRPSTAIWIPIADLAKVVRWNDDAIIRCIRDCVSVGRSSPRPTLQAAALQMGFSARTIQRELAHSGLDWSRLVDQVRLDRAAELLSADTRLSDIALELGYTDAANFGRAFRRWTGTTPRSFRKLAS